MFCRAFVFVALLVACGKDGGEEPSGPRLHVTVSVDWEGAYLNSPGLDALEEFRKANPTVPLTHFITAAYYTKADADPAEVTRELQLAIHKSDEVGLHIHAWKSLVEAAGVTYRASPSFLSAEGKAFDVGGDVGFDIELGAYTVEEQRAIMKKSRALLTREGFKLAPLFRAGGWLAPPSVLEAALAEGFTVDSSTTDPAWVRNEEGQAFLADRIAVVWPKVDRTTQPFFVDTPAGKILEMPDSGSFADHMTKEEMEDHALWAAGELKKDPSRPIFVHFGFHAETADEFAPRLTEALKSLHRRKVPMQFEVLSVAADTARAHLQKK